MVKKKKNNKQPQQLLSDEQFIKQKARNLPIEACYISSDMQKYGEGHITIVRRHPNEKFTIGVFLLDIFCLGVKDSFCKVRLDKFDYEDLMDHMASESLKEISYEEAHNWIYGAIAFAEEGGIAPHKSFNLSQYILEEDTEEIPLIEYEFGKDGQHFLMANNKLELSKYLPILEKNLGDNFHFVVPEDEYDEYDDYEEMEE